MLGKKNYLSAVIVVASIVLVICALVYYLFFTTRGSSFLIKSVITRYVKSKDIAHKLDIKTIEGSLSQKSTLQDIVIEDLIGLPQGSILKIQKLDVYFTSLSLEGLNLDVFNGRLLLPDSNPIIFYGRYHNNYFDFNVCSKSINVKNFVDLFMERQFLKNLSGKIEDLDIYLKGTYLEPELSGGFLIEELSRPGFSTVNCPTIFTIKLKDIKDQLKLNGELVINGGTISGPKTASVALQKSKIVFSGDPKKALLDIRGDSVVERTKINIILKGTADKPDLKLTSEPAMPEAKLMVMLATGKSWQGAERSVHQGSLSPDLIADFIDYFVFGGMGSKIAKQLGISDISLKFDEQTKGIEVKKDISSKAEISYGVQQSQPKEKEATVTQKVGGEYKITESVSVGAEKELKQDDKTEEAQDKAQTDDKVFIKFKKEF